MNKRDKLQHFDPSDTNSSAELADAALDLLEHISILDDRFMASLGMLEKREALSMALNLHFHEPIDILESPRSMMLRVLRERS